METKRKIKTRFDIVQYLSETFKNKLYALSLFGFGWLSVQVTDDATFLVVTTLVALPLFFARKNWIN